MIHPIPSGTRDVLPDEMREIGALVDTIRGVLADAGYGEVATPSLEYESVLERGGQSAAYRVVDDRGDVLWLRSDLTIPIARVAATRYAKTEPPLRFSSVANVFRPVTPHRGQMREFLQVGAELLGSPSPDGTAEVLELLCRALSAVGLEGFRIGLGSAALYPALLDAHGVDGEARARLVDALYTRDFVRLEHEVGELGLDADAAALLTEVPQRRGGMEVFDGLDGAVAARLRALHEMLEGGVAGRVIFDLGLARELGYYTGAIFEVYAPGLGAPLAGGGRYDTLLGRFGRDLAAVGFAITVDRLHEALARGDAS